MKGNYTLNSRFRSAFVNSEFTYAECSREKSSIREKSRCLQGKYSMYVNSEFTGTHNSVAGATK
jgi:hypothetical protein